MEDKKIKLRQDRNLFHALTRNENSVSYGTDRITKTQVNESLAQEFSSEICEICRNFFSAEHHRTTASGYSSLNSSKGRIGKLNHKL